MPRREGWLVAQCSGLGTWGMGVAKCVPSEWSPGRMHKDSFRSGKLGIPGLVLRTQLKPGGEVLCRRPHCQLSQVKPEGFSLRPKKAHLPLRPAAAVHRASPHPLLRPEPSGSSSPYLGVTAPGPATGGQSRRQPEESPTRSFLCGPLGFLSGCRLPKVMALWGPGRGRKSRKPLQQPCPSGC